MQPTASLSSDSERDASELASWGMPQTCNVRQSSANSTGFRSVGLDFLPLNAFERFHVPKSAKVPWDF